MKDEIKEILDKFDKVLENYELDKKWGQMSVDSICHLFPNEMIIIKDYIINLQEEVKFTEDYKDAYETTMIANKMLEEKYTDYKSRCEKAIEYGNNCLENIEEYDEYICESIDIVGLLRMIHKNYLDILQGEENDN